MLQRGADSACGGDGGFEMCLDSASGSLDWHMEVEAQGGGSYVFE